MGVVERGRLPRSVVSLLAWGRAWSLWVLPTATSCCGPEVDAALRASRFDASRLGVRVAAAPGAADVLLVAGPITPVRAAQLRRLHAAMPRPAYVLAVGACAIAGGPFAGNAGLRQTQGLGERVAPRGAGPGPSAGKAKESSAPGSEPVAVGRPASPQAVTEGAFSRVHDQGEENPTTARGAAALDTALHVDVYVPGCPPRPEAIVQGLGELQALIGREDPAERWQADG